MKLYDCCAGQQNASRCRKQVMKHASEGIHFGFETQRRHHQMSKTGVLVSIKKDMCPAIVCFLTGNSDILDSALMVD